MQLFPTKLLKIVSVFERLWYGVPILSVRVHIHFMFCNLILEIEFLVLMPFKLSSLGPR